MPSTRIEQASWLLAGLALLLILSLHLLAALLAGLLVFELVHRLAPHFAGRLSDHRARVVVVVLLAVCVIFALIGPLALAAGFFHAGGIHAVAQKMAEPLEHILQLLPDWLAALLPPGVDELQASAAQWLREHADALGNAGKEAGIGIAHVLIAMVIGALVALHDATGDAQRRPLAAALGERARRLSGAFGRIVFAQLQISLLNTLFTAVYLGVVLPLAGVHLPLTKTLIAITFITGLLPVVGNLISNSVIVLVSLAVSPSVALASLVFLIVIHKLEYFLNARIVGSRIAACAWELLLAMLAMEAAFGLPGLVAAPVYYAYLKEELGSAGLV